MADRVYAEKLTPPLPPQDLLARPRLAGLTGPATLITGGPGVGKSVALVQLMDGPSLFYALDEDDAEPAFFVRHVVAGMKRIVPEFDKALGGADQGELEPRRFWRAFFAALAAYNFPGIVLAFDDLQHLDPAWAAGLGNSLERLPAGVKVLAASRERRVLPLAKLVGKGALRVLDDAALRFTPAEVEAFLLARAGGRPVPAAWRAGAEKLDGWALGLRLLGEAGHGPAGADGLADYMREEVMVAQGPERQAFMRRAAMLQAPDPAACAAIFGDTDVAGHLEALEAAHLVQRLANGGFRFPTHVRSFLADEAAVAMPVAERDGLHARAAAYYQEAGRLELALPHWVARGDWEAAAAGGGRAFAQLEAEGRLVALGRWLDAFPAGFDSPVLAYWRGRTLAHGGQPALARERYEAARAGFHAREDEAGELKALVRLATHAAYERDTRRFHQLWLRAQALLEVGEDVDRADLCLLRALVADQRGDGALMEECNTAVLSLSASGPDLATCHCLAHLNLHTRALQRGDLDTARRHAGEAAALAAERGFAATALLAQFLEAHLHLLADEPEPAEALLRSLAPRWEEGLDWHDRACALVIVGHLHEVQGRWREAEEAYGKARALFEGAEYQEGVTLTLERWCWLLVRRGQPERALALAGAGASGEAAGAGGPKLDSYYDLALVVPLARARTLTGDAAGAVAALEGLLPELDRLEARLLKARALAVLAGAHQVLGQGERARARYDEARSAVEAGGFAFVPAQDPQLWAGLAEAQQPVKARAKTMKLVLPAAPQGSEGLSVRCFGGFEARRDGVLLNSWPRKKAKLVLAALALYPRGRSPLELAEALGEAVGQDLAAQRVNVMALRRVLEPELGKGEQSRFIGSADDGYRLVAAEVGYVDVHAFEAAVARAEALRQADPMAAEAAYDEALEHYRGNLLEDGALAGHFEPERRHYMRLALEALAYLAERREPREAFAAEKALRRAVELAPLEEEPYLALMRFQLRHQQPERVRQTYWDHRKALKAALGVAPSEAFEAAYQGLLG